MRAPEAGVHGTGTCQAVDHFTRINITDSLTRSGEYDFPCSSFPIQKRDSCGNVVQYRYQNSRNAMTGWKIVSWNKSSISARRHGVAILALLIVLPLAALAAVPQLINYQGLLTDSAGLPVPDGSYLINFKIYASPTYPAWLWASGPQSVTVSSGNFSYLLGSQVSFPAQLFDSDTIRYLGITVGTDPELSPRTRLVSTPYSFQALHADTSDYATTVPDQSISGAKLVDGTITDADVSATADIDPAKINGTAMVLSASWQTIFGFVEFTGPNVYMHDSSMQSSQYGLTIGSRAAHVLTALCLKYPAITTARRPGTEPGCDWITPPPEVSTEYNLKSNTRPPEAAALPTAPTAKPSATVRSVRVSTDWGRVRTRRSRPESVAA